MGKVSAVLIWPIGLAVVLGAAALLAGRPRAAPAAGPARVPAPADVPSLARRATAPAWEGPP
jgi:hypothetical protein